MNRTILHLSDPHFGAADQEIAEAFLDQIHGMEPDIAVLSGDLTMRARRRELAAAADFVSRLPRPLIVIPGNHDIPALNDPVGRFFRPFRRYASRFGVDLEPVLAVPGWHVVALNSSRPFGLNLDWSEGRLSCRAIAKMEERFAEADAGAVRVLVLHHPLVVPPGLKRGTVEPLGPLLGAMGRARVDLVLCGHFHRSHAARIPCGADGTAVVSQAPTVCSTRLQGEPPGYHEILSLGDGFEVRHYQYDGKGFVRSAVHRFVDS